MGGWTTVIVLFGLAFFGLPRQINGFQTSLLIRHTRDDTAEEFRHHVLIFVKGVHVCSGSIVNGGLILTAAQCMDEVDTKDVMLIARDGKKYRNVAKVLIHDRYEKAKFQRASPFDIAIVKIKGQIEYNEKVQPVFHGSKKEYDVRTWGYESVLELRMLKREDCKRIYTERLNDTVFCVMNKNDHDVCAIKIGSSIMTQTAGPIMVGFVIYSRSCTKDDPTLMSPIQMNKQWIDTTIEENMEIVPFNETTTMEPSAAVFNNARVSMMIVALLSAISNNFVV